MKLKSIYASKGPARKATLLKQLTLQRMQEGEDVREHIGKFFDAVDKLQAMDVEINKDLLSIMLLYSLPDSFENFRCAIESRDELPSAESLKIKILEENDARKQKTKESESGALFAKQRRYQNRARIGRRRTRDRRAETNIREFSTLKFAASNAIAPDTRAASARGRQKSIPPRKMTKRKSTYTISAREQKRKHGNWRLNHLRANGASTAVARRTYAATRENSRIFHQTSAPN